MSTQRSGTLLFARRIALLAALLLIVPCPVSAQTAKSWSDAATTVINGIAADEAEMERIAAAISAEKSALTAEIANLESAIAASQTELERMKGQLDTLGEQEAERRAQLEAQSAAELAVIDWIEQTRRDIHATLRSHPALPELPPELHLPKEADPSDMDQVKLMADLLFWRMDADRTIHRYTGRYVDAAGRVREGEILRIGPFTLYVRDDGHTGFLRWAADEETLFAIAGEPPWRIRRAIGRFFDGESRRAPLDITRGLVAEQAHKQGNILAWLSAGGPIVWPILLSGLLALLLCLERLWVLGRIPVHTDRLMNRLRGFAIDRNWQACRDLCDDHRNIPTCRMLKAGLFHIGKSREVMENALEEAILTETPRLERFLSTLAVLAALAPLMGLLGTVTGMIHTFQGITLFGTSDPRMLSGGISEALITTQLGLAVAIPITLIHHLLDRRVEKIVGDMEEKGTALITLLIAHRKAQPAAEEPCPN